jgi:Putative restriction endonuclease
MSLTTRATIEDFYKVEGKAELVHGAIVHMPPAGDAPHAASVEVVVSLRAYARRTGQERAYGDGVGFHVHLPHREAFSPDVAYYVGPRTGRRFLEGAPIFAVEIRSENAYGRAAERDMAAKRQRGRVPEQLALESLRERVLALGNAVPPAETQATLADYLSGYLGILHSSEHVPGGARLSDDSGWKFAAGLVAQRHQQQP